MRSKTDLFVDAQKQFDEWLDPEVDAQTFAETNRKAAGLRLGYGTERMQLSSAVEFRNDNADQLDTTHTERTAFLIRNSAKVQQTPDWRLLGKLN